MTHVISFLYLLVQRYPQVLMKTHFAVAGYKTSHDDTKEAEYHTSLAQKYERLLMSMDAAMALQSSEEE
jgi:hypothetical protein